MTAHTKTRQWLGFAGLAMAGALAALTVSSGIAAASPRSPLASDDPAPAAPFDPSALLNAVNDYVDLVPMLIGGQGSLPGLQAPGSAIPGLTSPNTLVPGLP
jgi:hypothetical protein